MQIFSYLDKLEQSFYIISNGLNPLREMVCLPENSGEWGRCGGAECRHKTPNPYADRVLLLEVARNEYQVF